MDREKLSYFYPHELEEIKPRKAPENKRAADACSNLDYRCAINIEAKTCYVTGIICTIGPACQEVKTIEKMIKNGMSMARLDFSTETCDYHIDLLLNVREAVRNYSAKVGMYVPIAIGLDTKGPEIRTGVLVGGVEAIEIREGTRVWITTNCENIFSCSEELIFIDYIRFGDVAEPGDMVIIDMEIKLEVKCTDSSNGYITCEVVTGGMLGNYKRVNLPGKKTDLLAVSEKDRLDIRLGIEAEVDVVFASYVRGAYDVEEYRRVLGQRGKNIKVIAKIQNILAWENIDEIIDIADGIIVDRGDLAIEIPQEKVFLVQKTIIARCNKVGKPVFCSSQMLESMITKSKATVRECTDVANAILDGVDGVMLSDETFRGAYPLKSVKTMAKICKRAETAIFHKQLFDNLTREMLEPVPPALALVLSVIRAANVCQAGAIVVMTTTGATAQLISKYRPPCPIIAVTCDERVARHCNLYRSVVPFLYNGLTMDDLPVDVETQVKGGLHYALIRKFVKPRDPVVVVSSWKELSGSTKSYHIMYI